MELVLGGSGGGGFLNTADWDASSSFFLFGGGEVALALLVNWADKEFKRPREEWPGAGPVRLLPGGVGG